MNNECLGLDEEVKVWLPTLSMNDSEEKKILKKKKDYMLRTISRFNIKINIWLVRVGFGLFLSLCVC